MNKSIKHVNIYEMTYSDKIFRLFETVAFSVVLDIKNISKAINGNITQAALKRTQRAIDESVFGFIVLNNNRLTDEHDRPAKKLVSDQLTLCARKKRKLILYAHLLKDNNDQSFLALNDARGRRRWVRLETNIGLMSALQNGLSAICESENKDIIVMPSGHLVGLLRPLVKRHRGQQVARRGKSSITVALQIYSHSQAEFLIERSASFSPQKSLRMSHLDRLEAESIHIFREVISEANNPVMLYSLGKDSSVMLHLAKKAFYPSSPPFPLLHVDTRWKFQAMYDFRDFMARESGMDLLVHINPEGIKKNINPLDHGSTIHTEIMKTQSLKMALEHYRFDVAFGGARRDEEKSRAKERIFSFRNEAHGWDPKDQRPELWNLYNSKKNNNESIRVFPISNWTELDIWQYIVREQIPIVPLYFAAERPVVERNGMLIMVDDDRLTLNAAETIQLKKIRFRTLGCYPLTGAIESEADDLASIILEILSSRSSERQGRAIDSDTDASMEKKKQEGYF